MERFVLSYLLRISKNCIALLVSSVLLLRGFCGCFFPPHFSHLLSNELLCRSQEIILLELELELFALV